MRLREPRLGWRISLTVPIVTMGAASYSLARKYQGQFQAEVAVRQLKDDAAAYLIARDRALQDLPSIVVLITSLALILIWRHLLLGNDDSK